MELNKIDMSMYNHIGMFLIVILFASCQQNSRENKEVVMGTNTKGTFGYDLELLKKYKETIVLTSEDLQSQIVICPEYQGRIMTSTAQGLNGYSFGWLNHELISSGETLDHFNPVGGEERLWLGPEGGQFSIFFKPNTKFDLDNWFTPKEIDTESFKTISFGKSEATFEKEMSLVNYSNTQFEIKIKRTIRLLEKAQIEKNLNVDISQDLSLVGFESQNILTNIGKNEWDKKSGMLSIWILSMLNPSPETTVIIPFRKGEEADLGKIVTDDYFGKVPADRLTVGNGILYFKADGKMRSKIGISPKRAIPMLGSYDAINKVLTVAQFTIPDDNTDFVNSLWQLQDKPFEGDAVNSYNDGPMQDGSQMGPFYEIESSSPAAALMPEESLTHIHKTYHFKGDEKDLNQLALSIFGIDIFTISTTR